MKNAERGIQNAECRMKNQESRKWNEAPGLSHSAFSIQHSAFFCPPHEVVAAVRAMQAPIVVAHVVPDADALGAMLALAGAWSGSGHGPKVSLPPASVSQRLTFLLDMVPIEMAAGEDFPRADGFVVLDTAKRPRCNVGSSLKDTDWWAGCRVVNIDHHATNTRFGDLNWIEDSAGSTCELVYQLIVAMKWPITPPVASLLYAGIQTDTLGFSLPTTSVSALRVCADLVERGANVELLGERLYRSQRRAEFDLLRVIYANTRVLAHGRLAYSSASHDEIHQCGCTAADIDDQINVPRSLEGVQLAILFSEGNRGKTRVNFRGSGPVTVSELAMQFRGGGHRQSAGAILDCGLQEAIEKVIPVTIEHLERFPSPSAPGQERDVAAPDFGGEMLGHGRRR
jgi:phosphoesterase RecJ-like protein